MLAVRNPPFKPVSVNHGGKKVWTVSQNSNNVFAFHIEPRVSVVGFSKEQDAIISAKIIETHVRYSNDWPDFSQDTNFYIKGEIDVEEPLSFLNLKQWDSDQLKVWSALNCMDLMVINSMQRTKKGYRFTGNRFTFEGPQEMYINRFNELYHLYDVSEDGM